MSWEQLSAILETHQNNVREETSSPPTACPIDGALLEIRGDGVRNCPMGNYTWGGSTK